MSSGADRQDSPDPIQDEAIAWVVRLTSGEATREDADAVRAWRRRSPAHDAAFRRASTAWNRIGAVAGDTGTPSAHGISRRMILTGAGAGTALAAGWAGGALGLLPTLDSLLSDHATGVGEQARFDLKDGSAVDLDAASALNVQLTDTARTVRLVSGAAAFDVAPDDRPFRAMAPPGDVTTLDGAFAVTLGSGTALVECTRNTIAVTCGETARLEAGERAVLTDGGVSGLQTIDPEDAAPWKRGLLVFENRPLSLVVEDVNRHRRGRVVLARPGLGDRRVNGVFHLDRPDEIVSSLADSLKLASVSLPAGIVVLR